MYLIFSLVKALIATSSFHDSKVLEANHHVNTVPGLLETLYSVLLIVGSDFCSFQVLLDGLCSLEH